MNKLTSIISQRKDGYYCHLAKKLNDPQTNAKNYWSLLSSIDFDDKDITKIISASNINKSYGHDDISIRMIKIYDSALVKSLSIIFNNCVRTGTFPYIWKKSNVIPVHKKTIGSLENELINNNSLYFFFNETLLGHFFSDRNFDRNKKSFKPFQVRGNNAVTERLLLPNFILPGSIL